MKYLLSILTALVVAALALVSPQAAGAVPFTDSFIVGTSQTKVSGEVLVSGQATSLKSIEVKDLTQAYRIDTGCGSACGGDAGDLEDYVVVGDYSKIVVAETDISQVAKLDQTSNERYCDVKVDLGGIEIGDRNSVITTVAKTKTYDTSKTVTETETKFEGKIYDGHKVVGSVLNEDWSQVTTAFNTVSVKTENFTEYKSESYLK